MTEILGLEHLALRPDGPTLTLSVSAGQSLSIVGPAGSGKSLLIRTLAGRERAAQGAVHLRGRAVVVGEAAFARRVKVQALARRPGIADEARSATDVLMATRLWDVRQSPVADLSPSQVAACELVEPLVGDHHIVFVDGQLDRLDPWALRSVLDLIRRQMSAGRTFIVATHRSDVVRELQALIVLNDRQVRFAGSVEDLLRAGPPHSIDVATENSEGVRALVAPFQVSVRSIEGGIRLEAPEGQEVAARLLLDGYGDVRYIVTRPPTVDEALRALL